MITHTSTALLDAHQHEDAESERSENSCSHIAVWGVIDNMEANGSLWLLAKRKLYLLDVSEGSAPEVGINLNLKHNLRSLLPPDEGVQLPAGACMSQHCQIRPDGTRCEVAGSRIPHASQQSELMTLYQWLPSVLHM